MVVTSHLHGELRCEHLNTRVYLAPCFSLRLCVEGINDMKTVFLGCYMSRLGDSLKIINQDWVPAFSIFTSQAPPLTLVAEHEHALVQCLNTGRYGVRCRRLLHLLFVYWSFMQRVIWWTSHAGRWSNAEIMCARSYPQSLPRSLL